MAGRTLTLLAAGAMVFTIAATGCGKKQVNTDDRDRTPPPVVEEPTEDTTDDAEMARQAAMNAIGAMIFFDFDRSDLREDARGTLQGKAEALREFPEVDVRIEGHADERGTIEYNLALGERRADSARRYLIDLGIDPDRLTTVSYGEERPMTPGSNEAAWADNRRDEFIAASN
jgi:peptidoglycan-associated lipoprotein